MDKDHYQILLEWMGELMDGDPLMESMEGKRLRALSLLMAFYEQETFK